uniref:Uncharacterized protein n=1 Tax=viral metagenome TaxID=1070528 RepID=A0A6M3LIJ7_9ZZZZ
MATINDLNISITKMPLHEVEALVKRLREARRTTKKTRVVVRRSTSAPTTKKDPLAGIDKSELLKLLEESLNG